jgi:hypothetical protein
MTLSDLEEVSNKPTAFEKAQRTAITFSVPIPPNQQQRLQTATRHDGRSFSQMRVQLEELPQFSKVLEGFKASSVRWRCQDKADKGPP